MPAGDRTGPRGEGPRTGRGLGDCETIEGRLNGRRSPAGQAPRGGRGLGAGGGRGGCMGRRRGKDGIVYFT